MVPTELSNWCRYWAKLADFLPLLGSCMATYRNLLAIVADIDNWDSISIDSSIYRKYIDCKCDVGVFADTFIRPMCDSMTQADRDLFVSQFEDYFLCSVQVAPFFQQRPPLAQISFFDYQELDELFAPDLNEFAVCFDDNLLTSLANTEPKRPHVQQTPSPNKRYKATDDLPSLSPYDFSQPTELPTDLQTETTLAFSFREELSPLC